MGLRDFSRRCHEQSPGQVRCGLGQDSRGVGNRDADFRCRSYIDIVVSHPIVRNPPERSICRHDLFWNGQGCFRKEDIGVAYTFHQFFDSWQFTRRPLKESDFHVRLPQHLLPNFRHSPRDKNPSRHNDPFPINAQRKLFRLPPQSSLRSENE